MGTFTAARYRTSRMSARHLTVSASTAALAILCPTSHPRMASAGEITILLQRMASESGAGRRQAYDEVVVLVYDELRRRARRHLRGERGDELQPTALVHDVYERLLQYRMPFANRQHFFNVAATAMRRLLIDRARNLRAIRRGERRHETTVDSETPAMALAGDPDLLLAVDEAMATLTPEQVRLTELRFFVGLTVQEAADVMELNVETARKRWRVIKALLASRLGDWSPDDE